MRTLKLLRAFSEKEIRQLDILVSGRKRKSLKDLYLQLKKFRNNKKDTVNADLFKAAFNKKHSVANDYLLKNELRLLNNIFYDYIAFTTFNRYSKKVGNLYNVWLARGLHTKGLYPEFKNEIDQFIVAAQKGTTPGDAIDLMEVKILGLMQHTANFDSHDEINRLVAQSQKEMIRRFRYGKRQLERTEACNDMMYKESMGIVNLANTPIDIQQIRSEEVTDLYEEYLMLQKYSYMGPPASLKIELLKRMAQILDMGAFLDHTVAGEKLNVRTNLATALLGQGEFCTAEMYLNQAVVLCDGWKKPVPAEVIIDLILVNALMEKNKEAIAVSDKYQAEIKGSPYEVACLLTRIFTYLFMQKPKQALELLPVNRGSETEQLEGRMAYIIALYLNDCPDLAYDDCVNLLRLIKTKKEGITAGYIHVCNWLKSYLHAMLQSKGERQKQLQQLNAELTQITKQENMFSRTNCSLLWLQRQMQAQSSCNK